MMMLMVVIALMRNSRKPAGAARVVPAQAMLTPDERDSATSVLAPTSRAFHTVVPRHVLMFPSIPLSATKHDESKKNAPLIECVLRLGRFFRPRAPRIQVEKRVI